MHFHWGGRGGGGAPAECIGGAVPPEPWAWGAAPRERGPGGIHSEGDAAVAPFPTPGPGTPVSEWSSEACIWRGFWAMHCPGAVVRDKGAFRCRGLTLVDGPAEQCHAAVNSTAHDDRAVPPRPPAAPEQRHVIATVGRVRPSGGRTRRRAARVAWPDRTRPPSASVLCASRAVPYSGRGGGGRDCDVVLVTFYKRDAIV